MEIQTKNYNFTIKPRTCLSTDKFDFFIDISNECDAQCLFCCNENKNADDIDLMQLEADCIKARDKIARFVISGGEPLLNSVKLEQLLKLLSSFGIEIKLITNGHKLKERLPILNKYGVSTVQLSRHHYLDDENDIIFSKKMLPFEVLGSMTGHHENMKFSINCLLIRNYIDSTKEIIRFLEACSQIGISSVKFVGLMKVNLYCHEYFVDYKEVINTLPMDFLQTDSREDEERCSCAHFIYVAENGTVINVRFRHIAIFTQTDRVVKFDADGIGRF
jgi:molybdenum cofactor biosynthesis enzyme MoaA